MKYDSGWEFIRYYVNFTTSMKNKYKQSTNDKLAMGPVCLVAYCAAGVGYVSLQFRSEFCSSLVGELLSWGATDGQPEAGSQILPLQVILQLSFHLQLSRSFWTATDWRTEVNLRRGCWNSLPVVCNSSLWVCTVGSCLPFSYEAI